jgi:hypothetical protein
MFDGVFKLAEVQAVTVEETDVFKGNIPFSGFEQCSRDTQQPEQSLSRTLFATR